MSYLSSTIFVSRRGRGFAALAWIAFFVVGLSGATATVILQDDFESGLLGAPWTTSATNNGRATVTGDFAPVSGTKHLVLDDSANDAVYSVAEATLMLDLSNKKNVTLTFKAKSLGNEPHAPPAGNFTTTRAYDGVAISADGGVTWRAVQSFATIDTSWQTFSISLDASVAALSAGYGANFRIRFSEYDNSPAPIDGIAFDDVFVTADDNQISLVELPSPLLEGTGSQTGYVLLAYSLSAPLVLDLSSSPAGTLNLPATVTIPAGATSVAFDFSVPDDAAVNLTRSVNVYASAPNVTALPGSVTIFDDEAPATTLTLPAQLTEGVFASNNATLSIARAAAVSLTVKLTATPSNELILPATVTIPAGLTSIAFTVQAVDDTRIDGNIAVSVSATAAGIPTANAQTTTVDNETRVVSITAPATLQEGASAFGTVSISGTLPDALVVNLSGVDPNMATVPATVTIQAGAISNTFPITAKDNNVRDGSRNLMITASASGFTSSSAVITIRDNEVATYRFSGLTDIVNISSPVNITVSAADIEGNVITGTSGTVNLVLVLSDGSTQPVTPSSVDFQGTGSWTGAVTLPNIATPGPRLRASDANGNSGDSKPFDIMRVLALTAGDLAWDATRNRIYASVPSAAGGTYANSVVAIDPATLQITASVSTGQDPGQLALTSGGEFLYAALNANGAVARIQPASMNLESSFFIGVSQYYGTLYAEDIATVAGQPNLLVVSQYRKSVSPRHNGVAVYDNGVMRPTKTQEHTGSNRIEPSADPTIFFGANNETSEYGFRRLELGASGMTEIQVDTTLQPGSEIISDGDTVITNAGGEIDGAKMKRIGAFNTSGVARPDRAANRVYFLEPQSSYADYYDKIAAFEPATLSLVRRLTIPVVNLPYSYSYTPFALIRWGANGLAFRTSTGIVLINSGQLVPSDPPADLKVMVQATPNPASVGNALTYTAQVTNQGPNTARNTILTATLSDSQTLQNAVASTGTASITGSVVTLPIGDLPSGNSTTLTITATPQSAGSLTCTSTATSTSLDANFADNTGFKLVSVGFQSAVDVVNQLRLTANNLLYDAPRNVLWATIPSTVDAPLGRSLVSINPSNGLISDPLPINANPRANCIALSGNGRYLYIGLVDAPEVDRVDLSTNPPTSLRIPLGLNQWSDASYAEDIEPLDGDGTSFLITTYGDDGAAVFDGTVRRANRSGIYTVDRIERTTTPNVFAGYDNSDTGFKLSRLSVTASGVAISQSTGGVIQYFNSDIKGAGDLLLATTGQLVNSTTLTQTLNLGVGGRACLDLPNSRGYLVNGPTIRAFDITNGSNTANLALPTTASGDWAQACVRWGLDGFAVLGPDKLYVARWSATIPPNIDSNADFISDAWEATNFGTLSVNAGADGDHDGISNAFEYFFNTSPTQMNGTPLTVSKTSGNVIHLIFPRRAQVNPASYRYETGVTLQDWTAASGVTESILSTQTVGGVQMQMIDAAIPAPPGVRAFARLKWLGP